MPRISESEIVIVGDTEYTTFGPTRETGWPEPHHHKEIVQIAAIKLNLATGQEVETFDRFVRPTINPNLTQYFTDLTGITQNEVDLHGVSFNVRLAEYTAFCGDYPAWVFNADGEVFEENCRLNGASFPFVSTPFNRVMPKLSAWGFEPNAFSSGTLYKAVGLKMGGHVHNALHDVRSMGAFLHYIHTH